MRRKKILLITLCAALILAVAVVGTIAYLTHKTEVVNNTFTIGKIIDNPENFVLKEHKATDDDKDGVYVLGVEEVLTNAYTVLPGVDLPKDPFVQVKEEKLQLDAYVFIEVVDKTGTSVSFTVDTNKWIDLDKKGPNTGKVYAYKDIAQADAEFGPVEILKKNSNEKQITVANDPITDAAAQFGGDVTFYGYMIQAGGFETAEEAWEAGFAPQN